jgi:hypothetical protein
MMNDRSTGRIVGATPGPHKVKKKKTDQTTNVGPQPCKLEVNKNKKQAPTSPTASAGPQPCKVEPNNNKQQPTNQGRRSTH